MSNIANLITAGDRIEILPAGGGAASVEYEVTEVSSGLCGVRRVDDGVTGWIDPPGLERRGNTIRIVSESHP